MTDSYLRIEDIVEGLSADLSERGFSRVDPKENEIVRYAKVDSPIGFQVGMAQGNNPAVEIEFNRIYLSLGCNLPESVQKHGGEKITPNSDLMRSFFRNSPKYGQGMFFREDSFQDGRMNLSCYLYFEKENTKTVEMKAVLREGVDYLCNYVTINARMLTKTQSFSE